MKCNDFESVLQELARNQIVDASQREQAIAHMDDCVECRSRLDEQRSITSGLRALAEDYEEREAPPRIEAALIESFRRLNGSVVISDKEAPASFRRNTRHYVFRYAAAAAILLVLGLAAWQLEGVISREDKEQATQNTKPERVEPQQDKQEVAKENESQDKQIVVNNTKPKETRKKYSSNASKRAKKHDPVEKSTLAKNEIMTEFIPLVDFANISELDRGRLLRVQVPRSTLLSFGLPVNEARADEPLIADLLVGDDGLARAIRFVR